MDRKMYGYTAIECERLCIWKKGFGEKRMRRMFEWGNKANNSDSFGSKLNLIASKWSNAYLAHMLLKFRNWCNLLFINSDAAMIAMKPNEAKRSLQICVYNFGASASSSVYVVVRLLETTSLCVCLCVCVFYSNNTQRRSGLCYHPEY